MRKRRRLVAGAFAALLAIVSSPVEGQEEEFRCIPTEVRELGNRIHVRCAEPYQLDSQGVRATIIFFAINKDDPERATRFAAMATTAMTCGYVFWVRFPVQGGRPDNVGSCDAENCRTPIAFSIRR